jgi:uncharacterized protein
VTDTKAAAAWKSSRAIESPSRIPVPATRDSSLRVEPAGPARVWPRLTMARQKGIFSIPLLLAGVFRVEFSFDPDKSAANAEKHGIDFIAAQGLWLDEMVIEVPARTVDEPRWLVVGMIAGKHWSAVITRRDDATRIISVRRSRPEEVKLYETLE